MTTARTTQTSNGQIRQLCSPLRIKPTLSLPTALSGEVSERTTEERATCLQTMTCTSPKRLKSALTPSPKGPKPCFPALSPKASFRAFLRFQKSQASSPRSGTRPRELTLSIKHIEHFCLSQTLGDERGRETPMWPIEPASETDSAEEEIIERFPLPSSALMVWAYSAYMAA